MLLARLAHAWVLLLCFSLAFGAAAEPVEITLLYTNDIHGYALPEPAEWARDKAPIGGLIALEHAVREERARAKLSLLLDGGDILTGQPSSDFPYQGAVGGYLVEAMNRLRYDAAALGNHEFDAGLENLRALMRLARFPFLSANLKDTRPEPLPFLPYKVFERGSLKIAVIGVMTPKLPRMVAPKLIEPFQVADPAKTLQPLIDRLAKEADLVVLLSHVGHAEERDLARALKGVHVILGGHSHSRIRRPALIGDTLVCQAGCYLANLGVLRLAVENKRVVRHSGELRELWHRSATSPSAEMRELVGEVKEKVDRLMADRLGELKTPWVKNRMAESNVGTFLAGCLAARAGAEVGFLNSGGIRTNLPAGPLSRGQLMTVLPFPNKLVRFEATGEELVAVCRNNALAVVTGDHGVLQMSGLSYRWKRKGRTDVEVSEVKVAGQPVDKKKSYRCATNDYIALHQPKKYLGIVPSKVEVLDAVVTEAVASEIKQRGAVEARTAGTMVEER